LDIATLLAEQRFIPEPVIVLRLALPMLFGAVVGLDREFRQHPAGLRTHMLIAAAGPPSSPSSPWSCSPCCTPSSTGCSTARAATRATRKGPGQPRPAGPSQPVAAAGLASFASTSAAISKDRSLAAWSWTCPVMITSSGA